MQPRDELRIVGCKGLELAAVTVDTGDLLALYRDFADLAVVDLREKVGERDADLTVAARRLLEQVEQRDQQKADDDPEREVSTEITHRFAFPGRTRAAPAQSTMGRRSGTSPL